MAATGPVRNAAWETVIWENLLTVEVNMKAILLEEPGQLTTVQIDAPAEVGPGEVLVRVHCVGICGTDVSGYLGRMPFYSYPRIPGHELGVEVVRVGPSVENVRPGDRCSVEPYMNCQRCYACRIGKTNCCQHLQVLGVHTDGGLRSHIVVPARKLHPGNQLEWEQLALVETLSIGCHAVGRAAAQSGEFALVIGAGPIGLSVVEFARLAGLRLAVMDINQRRLDFCRESIGVDHVVRLSNDNPDISLKQIKDWTNGDLPSVVFDATGNPESMCQAASYVAHSGKLVYVGLISSEVHLSHPLLHAREITLLASRNSQPSEFLQVIRQIEEQNIDTRPWITHRSTFDDLVVQFESYLRPETGVVKAVVDVD